LEEECSGWSWNEVWSEGRVWVRMEKVWGWKPLERESEVLGRVGKEERFFLCSLR